MRIDRDERRLRMAEAEALGSTCFRRAVGCVLTDARGKVLATGYNGVASGASHCNESSAVPVIFNDEGKALKTRETYPFACASAGMPTGQGLDGCDAVHAEANALMQCDDVQAIETCYTTTSPCRECTKLLLNTGCKRVIYRDRYVKDGLDLWTKHRLRGVWIRLERKE